MVSYKPALKTLQKAYKSTWKARVTTIHKGKMRGSIINIPIETQVPCKELFVLKLCHSLCMRDKSFNKVSRDCIRVGLWKSLNQNLKDKVKTELLLGREGCSDQPEAGPKQWLQCLW